jgi:hypothetical protein
MSKQSLPVNICKLLSIRVKITKIGSLMTQFSLHQLITEPTYVTEHISSLLDLILVSNSLSVLFTDVGAPLLEPVRYHLPVIGLLHHSSKPFCFNFFRYCRKIIILCHFYQIIAFVPGYTILFPMVYRICMFCFFMDSIHFMTN